MASRLLCAAAIPLACPVTATAQQASDPTDPGELDPSAPLEALPDLGVEWPDLDTPDPAEPAAPDAPQRADIPASGTIRYAVAIAGLERVGASEDIIAAFREQSALAQEREDPANAAQVDRRSRADSELLAELLRSRGYYDAAVEPAIAREGDVLNVVLTAQPGEQYRFSAVALPGLEAAGEQSDALRRAFAVEAGDPVIAEDVIAAGLALKVALGEQGFALATVGEQDIEIDHQSRRATLRLPVSPGPLARFGALRVSGQPPFSAQHVATVARFESGEPFRQSKVDDLRRALIATGLVSSAEVRVVPSADRRTVDLAVSLAPAPMRTIAGEVGYGTGEGLRAEASWQHRNFFNPEGALTLRGVVGTREKLAAVQFRRNNFLQRDQVLNLQLSASDINFDAYEARTLLLAGNFERQSNIIWHKKWTWSVGADLLVTDELGVFEDPSLKTARAFFITALPLTLGYDGSDSLLDPTTGFRLLGRVSPEYSMRSGGFGYVRAQFDASAYRPLSDSVVAAGRVRVGTIAGAEASQIAPSRRFYSGGGGSVRGYGYQSLGPRDFAGDPVGGRGLAEFALEARVRLKAFGGNFGVVPFLDGGSLTSDIRPSARNWQFGAGVGLRYYSSFGPIRVDLGTPLNPRRGDGRLAVTVSLGQAF